MLTIKHPSFQPKQTPQTKKTRLKTRLQQGSLFALAGLMVFTIMNPAYALQLYNELNPATPKRQDVAALSSPLNSPFALPVAQSTDVLSLERQELNAKSTIERKPVKELTDKRTAYTKTFLNSDGTKTMEYTTEQQHYQKDKDSPWEEIDNTLEEKKTKDDIRYFEGDAGAMSSTMKRLSEGLSIDAADKQIAIKPVGAANVQPERKDDRTIVYRDAWPGVDLEYELRGESVKEVIIVKSNLAPTTFNFNVAGGKVVAHSTEKDALTIEGLPKEYHFTPLSLDVNGRGVISEERVTQSATTNGIAISFDKKWFESQDSNAFPMRIDPSLTKEASSYKMFKSDGYSCTGAICYASIGSINDGGWKHWRSYFTFPYSELNNKTVLSANLEGVYQNGAGGDTNSRTITLGHASCTNAFNCLGTSVGSTTASKNFTINFTSKLKSLVDAKTWNIWWSLKGAEGSYHSFKPYHTLKAVVTYDTPTPMAVAATPSNGATVVTTQPTVQVNTVTDPDGDAVQYYHRISTNPDAETGAVINSGWTSSRQWTVPEYILQDGRTYYWHTYTRGNVNVPITDPNWVRSFKVDLRTGKNSTQAYEEVGPIALDLATGNATTSTGSHSISALGGDIGLALNYNTPALVQSGTAPKTATKYGLTGYYYNDPGATRTLPSNPTDPSRLLMVRRDQNLSFVWGNGSPSTGLPTDNFLVRWKGFITVPTAGSYTLGINADDGVRIKTGTGLLGTDETVFDDWSYVAGNRWGAAKNLPANTPIPITVEYYEATGPAHFDLLIRNGPGVNEQKVPATWLSPNTNVLPDGWELGMGLADINFERLQVSSSSAILSDSTGQKHEYIWNSTNQTYTPPKNQEAKLYRNSNNTHTVIDVDGHTYIFDIEGKLTSLTAPGDDVHSVALKYEYDSLSRLVKISDGVNNARNGTLYYAGDSECQVMSGFDAVPSSYLCAFKTTDGKKTTFQYKNGNLARIAQPGDEYNDYQYDALGRITAFRDSLANDAIAYSVRADDATTNTEISYNLSGKVTAIKSPAPTVGAARQEVTTEYLSGATAFHVTGAAEPHGFSRKVTYDSLFRTTGDTDVTNLTTTTQWHPDKDLVLSATAPTGLKSTTIYDSNDRPTDSYGAAPSSWFDSNNKPFPTYTNDVPHIETTYDENINGLGVAVYDNTSLLGTPKLNTLGMTLIGAPTYAIDLGNSIVTPTDGLSIRATGKIKLDQVGLYDFSIHHSGGARLYIDNQLVIDDWTSGGERSSDGGLYTNATAGKYVDIIIEVNKTGTAGTGANNRILATLSQKLPGASSYATAYLNQQLFPAYNLTTSTTAYDAQLGNTKTQTIYSKPEYGLIDKTVIDSTSLNYQNKAEYEAVGTGFLRQTSRTSPGGAKTIYEYYSATETRDNPCTVPVESILQGGLGKKTTEADPDGIGYGYQEGRANESIYDTSGNIVASRYNDEPWSCTTYDDRGRVISTKIPSHDGKPQRIITYSYLISGNPLASSVADYTGEVVTETDLLGRPIEYTGVFGNSTQIAYDSLGRMTSRVSLIGTESFEYDTYDRLVSHKLDSVEFAAVSYDAYGRVDSVDYGSDISLDQITRDALDRETGLTFTDSTGEIAKDTVTRYTSGAIKEGTENGVSKSYTYDKAGRLVGADIGDNNFSYEFGWLDTSCNGLMGLNPFTSRNGNRTKMTLNGQSTTYCYDEADRLLTSSDGALTDVQYDSHGNVIYIGDPAHYTQLQYDVSDRNLRIISGDKEITYGRDALDRITSRVVKQNGSIIEQTKYGYSNDDDTPAFTMDAGGNLTQSYLTLPGGVTVTIDPSATGAASQTYSLPNIHGDTMATVDADGVVTGKYMTGPFGETLPITPSALSSGMPNNTGNTTSSAYLGKYRKATDQTVAPITGGIIQMGARPYIPALGRFLSVDPVDGGTDNDYAYPTDPVNTVDTEGEAVWLLVPVLLRIVAQQAAKAAAKKAAQEAAKRAAQQAAKKAADEARKRAAEAARKKIAEAARKKAQEEALKLARQLAIKKVLADPRVGREIMKGKIGDPGFSRIDGWRKMEYVHRALDGTKIVVHYFYNISTRAVKQAKIK